MKFAPVPIPAMALLQQHDAPRDILTEPAARRGAVQRSKLWGIWNWGRNRAVKTNRLVFVCAFDIFHQINLEQGRSDMVWCTDTSDPRHFGTMETGPKCPDSSAPVPKCP